MRLACFVLALTTMLGDPAVALDARDRTFAPGRVGAIVKGVTKPADLARIYGARNIRREMMDELGGGDLHPGAYVFFKSANSLEVHFTGKGKAISYVIVLGRNWKSKEGLRVGSTAADLERLNGGPFKFYGFGFDYGGQVFASGPAFKGYTIYVKPTGDDQAAIQELTKPETQISSDHPAVARAGLEVSFIHVHFGAQ